MAKRWVIGDIHGCLRSLKALIEEQIQPEKEDHLYFVGDYIDRGPASKGVVDYIMELRMMRDNVFLLKGNHEDMMVAAYRGQLKEQNWFYNGGLSTLNSFGVKHVRNIPGHYIDFLEELDYYIELDDVVLVHAGLNFELENPFEDQHAMLWMRNDKIIPEKIGKKKMVHGHTPITLNEIKASLDAKDNYAIDLDNGCVYYGVDGLGNLVALELNNSDLKVQKNLDI